MTKTEFEESRNVQARALRAMSKAPPVEMIKVIDLVERLNDLVDQLLDREPSELVVLPDFFIGKGFALWT